MDYRQRIISAFKELAAVQGISRVTVDELAERTGISKRTIYRYFESKEQIIVSVLEDIMSAMGQKVQEALGSSDDPVEKITNITKVIPENIKLFFPVAFYDLQKYYPHLWEKIEQFRAARVLQIYDGLISDDDKSSFKNIHPKIFTTSLLASMRAVLNPAYILENNLTLEEAIEQLFTLFLYGVVKEK